MFYELAVNIFRNGRAGLGRINGDRRPEVGAQLGVPPRRWTQARQAILMAQLRSETIGGCWLVRMAPNAPLWHQARHASLPRSITTLVGGYLGQLTATAAAWWFIGHSVLSGNYPKSENIRFNLVDQSKINFTKLLPNILKQQGYQTFYCIRGHVALFRHS